MRRSPILTLACAMLAALAIMTSTAAAQTATGQITGTVRDATGAVMSGVKVVVTNSRPVSLAKRRPDANGDYVVPLLPAGVYVVTAEQAGFKTAMLSDVVLTVEQIQRLDLRWRPATCRRPSKCKRTRSCSIRPAPRSATRSPRGRSRNCRSTAATSCSCCSSAPAPSRPTGEQGGMRQGVGNAISIMGARPTSNNFMIDGTANIDTSIGTPAAVLSVDAIQEFKEQTTTYSAEYGFSSNQINLVSKTGTNDLHGTGFGFFRNDAWDARNFFDDKTAPAPELDQKQFGFVVGGPVMLPGTTAEPHVLPRQLRGDADRPRRDELLHRADAGAAVGTLQHADHRSGDRHAVRRTTRFRSRDSRGSRSSRSGTTGSRRRTRRRRRATTRPCERFRRCRTSSRIRGDQDLGQLRPRVLPLHRTPRYENTTASQHHRCSATGCSCRTRTNWQVSHSWPIRNTLVNQFRLGRVDARADQRGIAVPAVGRGLPQCDGRVHQHSRRPARVSAASR